MNTFRSHLKEMLEDEEFAKLYNEEQQLIEISLKIAELRKKAGITQKELSKRAQVTQRQLSKIENGISYNILTLLKVCNAINLRVSLKS